MMPRFQVSTLTHDEKDPPSVGGRMWEMAALSSDDLVDDRSKAATTFVRNHAKDHFEVRFLVESNLTYVNKQKASFGKLRAQLAGVNSLLIEATSLSYPELLYLLTAATQECVKSISLLYVEPVGYRRTIDNHLCDHRNFNLSENRRFRSIPMFMTNLSEIVTGQAVFFLGYEGARFGQAMQQEEVLQPWRKHIVFGVPAFESGWEIDAIANNVDYLSSNDQIQYVAASSVSAAYRLLNELREDDKENNPVLVAPLGTKPHAIAAALFLIEHEAMDQAVLLYDHPDRSDARTEDVKRWHLYDVIDAKSN